MKDICMLRLQTPAPGKLYCCSKKSNNLPRGHHTTPRNKHCRERNTHTLPRSAPSMLHGTTVSTYWEHTSSCGYSLHNAVAHTCLFDVALNPTVELHSLSVCVLESRSGAAAARRSILREKWCFRPLAVSCNGRHSAKPCNNEPWIWFGFGCM